MSEYTAARSRHSGGVNAALLAIEILAVEDGELAQKLADKRWTDAQNVLKKDAALSSALQ